MGRLAISRNAKQRIASTTNSKYYSYTKYDWLGRITEVGQVRDTTPTIVADTFTRNTLALDSWHTGLLRKREQVTSTVYDTAYNFYGLAPGNTVAQQHVRNRVSFVKYSELPGMSEAYDHASFYSYDIHGNVDTLVQDYGIAGSRPNLMNKNGNRWKKIVYEYDLISGKVNQVTYQPRLADQWTHRYFYDAENRLTEVQTSEDGISWEKEAKYEHYLHGPLARTTLGQEQVQGIDYAYTLQGWLKGLNSASYLQDMGGDSKAGVNQYVGRDALGLSLNYYDGEYKPVKAGVTPFPSYRGGAGSALPDSAYRPLYNGNISSVLYNIRKFEENSHVPAFYNYRYDQLNRYIGQDGFFNFNAGNNSYGDFTPVNTYKERVSYDANGNIQAFTRYNIHPYGTPMDELAYKYYPGTNQLRQVTDQTPDWDFGAPVYDIDNQADTSNYVYDSIGNLIEDKAEKITSIQWNVYGKITEIRRNASITDQNTTFWTKYRYDAQGNRIAKEWLWYDQTSWDPHYQKNYTWYVRDAQGNLLSTYGGFTRDTSASLNLANVFVQQEDLQVYGSSRLGMFRPENPRNVDDTTGVGLLFPYYGTTHYRGIRQYELANHLGNVLTTVSDRKIGVYSGSSLIVDSANNVSVPVYSLYEAEKLAAYDYFPFGMVSRMNVNDGRYRFGFNGKENDNEVKGGVGSQQDYGMRVYDPRLGRFLSVDPLTKDYPWNSPFAFAENEPISNIDLDGLEQRKTNIAYAFGNGIIYGAKEMFDGTKQAGVTIFSPQTYKNLYDKSKDVVVEGVKDPNTLVTRYTTFMTKWSRSFGKGITSFAKAPGLWVYNAPKRTAEENAFDLGYLTWKGFELYASFKIPELVESRGGTLVTEEAIGERKGGSFDHKINFKNGLDNCAGCSLAGDASLKGYPASALDHGATSVENVKSYFGSRQWKPVNSTSSFIKNLSKMEDGTTGIMFGTIPGKADGHFFNVVKKDGVIQFMDFQKQGSALMDKTELSDFGELWF